MQSMSAVEACPEHAEGGDCGASWVSAGRFDACQYVLNTPKLKRTPWLLPIRRQVWEHAILDPARGGLRLNRKIGLLIILLFCCVCALSRHCRFVPAWVGRRSGGDWHARLPAMAGSPGVTPGTAILPTQPPQPTRTPAPRGDGVTCCAPRHPKRIIITETDVLNAVARRCRRGSKGWRLVGLGVKFTEGQMHLTADRLSYGPADVLDLVLVGSWLRKMGVCNWRPSWIARRADHIVDPPFANQAWRSMRRNGMSKRCARWRGGWS